MPNWIRHLLPSMIMVIIIANQRRFRHNSLDQQNWFNEYDYIVVGAGASGCVVASRLAEDKSKTVLLIEAGGPQTVRSDVPALQQTLFGTELDWKYKTVPQKFCHLRLHENNSVTVPRGKAFGGSSAINSMNYYRENQEYFQFWSDLTGVDNWEFEDVLPYFMKSENNLDDNIVAKNPEYHRRGGLLSVSTQEPDPILKNYVIAANMYGSPTTFTDGRQPFGTTIMQRTIKNGVRQSSSVAFLESRSQPNRDSIGHSFVTRILFDNNKRAIGVEFKRKNKYFKVKARKEVIVSAGAIGSPKLLMNSGIGPKSHLQELNIKVISDLPVGNKTLQSAEALIMFDIKDQTLIEKPIENDDNYKRYFIDGSGPLAYKLSAVTCFKELSAPDHPNLSNGCILPRLGYLGTDLDKIVSEHKLKEEWKEYYRPYLNKTYLTLFALLKKPRSVGTIRLKSSDPLDPPLIDPCIFCDQRDLNDLIEVFKLSLKVLLSPHMSKYIENYVKPIPGCKPCSDNFYCDSYLKCLIQMNTNEIYPMGGCQMGVKGHPNAVVDKYLKVVGVSSLRVIDSSVIPVNTEQSYAISVMIGERGSDFIKRDYDL